MSKYIKGYMGDQIGKLGPAVGRRWKGKSVMSAYQKYVHNPRTAEQLTVRARFARLVELSKAMRWVLPLGMGAHAKTLGMTESNVFMKKNWAQVTALTADDVTVNYSGLQLSSGELPEATFGQVDYGTASHLHIEATLTGGEDQAGADATDDVYLFAYCPELKQGCLGSAAKRTAAKVSVNVPASWDGMEVQLYGFAVGGRKGFNKGMPSATAYCGSGEVA